MAELRESELADSAVRGGRRIRIRRWAVAASASVLLGGSAGAAVVLLTAPTSPLAPTVSPAMESAAPAGGAIGARSEALSTEAAIYEAALRDGPAPAAGDRYVESVRCRGTKPGLEPCDLQPIPQSVQDEVRAALPDVRFVTRAETAGLHGGVLVRFGRITYSDGAATRAYLPVDVYCGPLCGEGTTLVLTRQANGTWAVTGRAGTSWIS